MSEENYRVGQLAIMLFSKPETRNENGAIVVTSESQASSVRIEAIEHGSHEAARAYVAAQSTSRRQGVAGGHHESLSRGELEGAASTTRRNGTETIAAWFAIRSQSFLVTIIGIEGMVTHRVIFDSLEASSMEADSAEATPEDSPASSLDSAAHENALHESAAQSQETDEVENLAWVNQLALAFRENLTVQAAALLIARWNFEKLTPAVLNFVKERGGTALQNVMGDMQKREQARLSTVNDLYRQGMSYEDAERLTRPDIFAAPTEDNAWGSLAFYLPVVAATRGESTADPAGQALCLRLLAGENPVSEFVAASPVSMDFSRPGLMVLRTAVSEVTAGGTARTVNAQAVNQAVESMLGTAMVRYFLLQSVGKEAAMDVARLDIPKLFSGGVPMAAGAPPSPANSFGAPLASPPSSASAMPSPALMAHAFQLGGALFENDGTPHLGVLGLDSFRDRVAAAARMQLVEKQVLAEELMRTLITKQPHTASALALGFSLQLATILGRSGRVPEPLLERISGFAEMAGIDVTRRTELATKLRAAQPGNHGIAVAQFLERGTEAVFGGIPSAPGTAQDMSQHRTDGLLDIELPYAALSHDDPLQLTLQKIAAIVADRPSARGVRLQGRVLGSGPINEQQCEAAAKQMLLQHHPESTHGTVITSSTRGPDQLGFAARDLAAAMKRDTSSVDKYRDLIDLLVEIANNLAPPKRLIVAIARLIIVSPTDNRTWKSPDKSLLYLVVDAESGRCVACDLPAA